MKQILIDDLAEIKKWLKSMASCTWGAGELDGENLYQLATTSPLRKGAEGLQLVCSMDDYEAAKKENWIADFEEVAFGAIHDCSEVTAEFMDEAYGDGLSPLQAVNSYSDK